MNQKKKLILIASILIIAIIVGLIIIHKPFYYAGTVEATQIDLSARVQSTIAEIPVTEGMEIKTGDLLMQLSCEDIKIAFAQAEKDFQRAAKLYDQGSLPQETYEHIRFKYEDNKIKLDWCTIKSPIDGTVLQRYREPGELISPGTHLFTLANLNRVYTYIYVEGAIISRLKLGDKIEATIPEMGMKKIDGHIERINDEAEFTPKNVQTREERTRLVYGVKIYFSNESRLLKPGMTVEVKIRD
jgi:HlyD family secretion protein